MTLYGQFIVVSHKNLFLTYSIPTQYSNISTHSLWIVPLRGAAKNAGRAIGIFLNYCEKPSYNCKEVLENYLPEISINPDQIKISQFLDHYYLSHPTQSMPILAPGILWDLKNKNMWEKQIESLSAETPPLLSEKHLKPPVQLTELQENAKQFILNHQTTLLHGVTGSGKTEVYIQCAQHVLSQGKTVLILIPEIALTPQLTKKFQNVFGENLAVIHSKLSKKKYMENWLRILLQRAKIVVGVRSAIFCPLQNIGLIITDEEHDSSYKNQKNPFYHSRDLCVMRAHFSQGICILGSGTPSLESFYNTTLKKYEYFHLAEKFSQQKVNYEIIPSHGVDQRKNQTLKRSSQISSSHFYVEPEILEKMRATLQKKEQIIILFNRRGYFNFAVCSQCKSPLTCSDCSVTTTLHHFGAEEICHYCEKKFPARKQCPQCHQELFLWKGAGTQHLENEIKKEFPDASFGRFDRDTTSTFQKMNDIIEKFRNHDIDILIGTQMLSKGHDFHSVSLVVAFYLEDLLFLPDFRANERVFQLILQTMGRTGRGSKPGLFLMQSLFRENPITKISLENDFETFYRQELSRRQLFRLPPTYRQILIEVKHKKQEQALNIIQDIKTAILTFCKNKKGVGEKLLIYGPTEAFIQKVSLFFRSQITLQFPKNISPCDVYPKELIAAKKYAQFVSCDVDPYSFL